MQRRGGKGIITFKVTDKTGPIVALKEVQPDDELMMITRHGIITRRGHDIPLARVSDISIEINLIDRPFGCGSLLIADASANQPARLNDIPHVEAAQRQLNELLHELHQGGGRRDGRDEGV